MSRLFRSTLLVATASMAAGLLVSPAAAFADDTTTSLTKAEMSAALKTVATTSTTAAKDGWRGTMSVSGAMSTFIVDPVGGVAYVKWQVSGYNDTEYAVQGKGNYTYLSDSTSLAAVKVMARPSVRYVFDADKSLVLANYVDDNLPSPSSVVSEDAYAGTKTVHDDGSTDYAFVAVDNHENTAVTLHVDTAGTLAAANASGEGYKVAITYAYGAQKLTLPAASVTVDRASLDKARSYLNMAANVKTAATKGAAHTRTAAKHKTVKVASLRKIVRKDATAVNKAVGRTIVKVVNVKNGVKVYATNPWTHKTVAYTVKAAGKKVIVKKV